jgi:hypothetical protein
MAVHHLPILIARDAGGYQKPMKRQQFTPTAHTPKAGETAGKVAPTRMCDRAKCGKSRE